MAAGGDALNMRFRESGDGFPLVMVHGYLGRRRAMAAMDGKTARRIARYRAVPARFRRQRRYVAAAIC